MMMWQRSAPSNPTIQIHQTNLSLDKDSPSDPPGLQEEETLEFQEEYPQEVEEEEEEAEEEAEEEDFPLQYPHNKELLVQETNSSAIHRSFLQEIAPNQKCS